MNNIASTDAELVAATLGGNRQAFGALVERHQQFVCALAYARTGSVAASEDIAQETFVAAWKNLARLRAPENFRGWLSGTARHLAARFHRGRQSTDSLSEEIAAAGPGPSEEAMTREEEAMLWATLEQLPENFREPLVLFYRGGQSVQEIAAALEISEDAAKQRLSRGRALLQETVRAQVESALEHSRPGAAFTIAVLAAIPALTTTAQAAGTGLAVAKGAGTLAASGLFSMLGGLVIGLSGAWFGMKCSLDRAESERERRFIGRATWWTMATISFFMAGLLALALLAGPMEVSWPKLWIGLMALVCLGFVGSIFLFGFLNTRAHQRIREEERLKRGAPAWAAADPTLFEYRSRREFLGLPLVHVRLGGCSMNVVKGWVAYGTIAISPFIACGGVAIGPIAMGGLAVGLLTTAGIGLGLFSFSALALGGVVMGGLAIGWIAIGGAAWGWLAAFGGQAWAGIYGLGRHVSAPHANDAAAKAFFHDHGIMQVAGWIADHGWWAQLAVFGPIMLMLVWVRRLRRRQKFGNAALILLLPLFGLSGAPKKVEQGAMEIAVKTVPETLFFCVAEEVAQAEIPAFAERAVGPLFEALGARGQHPIGDLHFICPQWMGPEAKSRIVFAVPVAAEFPVEAPYYLWRSPAFKCAWIEYQGPMSGIKEAWGHFGAAVEQTSHRPVGSWREVYVHWVAPESAEDRTELQMGIE